MTLEGFCQIIKDVHLSSGLPVLADADTGFGEGEMCAKTVWEYFNAGAAGITPPNNILYLLFLKVSTLKTNCSPKDAVTLMENP